MSCQRGADEGMALTERLAMSPWYNECIKLRLSSRMLDLTERGAQEKRASRSKYDLDRESTNSKIRMHDNRSSQTEVLRHSLWIALECRDVSIGSKLGWHWAILMVVHESVFDPSKDDLETVVDTPML